MWLAFRKHSAGSIVSGSLESDDCFVDGICRVCVVECANNDTNEIDEDFFDLFSQLCSECEV
jgi:hypothetical protein